MEKRKYITIPELAKILGLSRIAIYKKVKKGEIEAIKVGRTFAISQENLVSILEKALTEKNKQEIIDAVKRTVREYGEVLKLLGQE